MEDNIDSPTPPSCDDAVPPGLARPRLGIIHFLAWTACTAVCLSVRQTLSGVTANPPGIQEPAGFSVFYAIAIGAILGGFWLMARLRGQGCRVPGYPGEYQLLILGSQVLIWQGIRAGLSPSTYLVFAWVIFLVNLLAGGLYFWAFLAAEPKAWRFFFLVHGIFSIFLYNTTVSGWFYHLFGANFYLVDTVFLLLLLGFVVRCDGRAGRHYPWTHWLGVAVTVWLRLMAIAHYVWWQFGQ